MPVTIGIYDKEVRLAPPSRKGCCVVDRSLQIRRPATVVVTGKAPFVPRFLEQVGDASTQKEVVSRVQGRHLSLQSQSGARARAKKSGKKEGIKVPRLRPKSWKLAGDETK